MLEDKRPLKVFLSYASQDKPVVRELSRQLASEGWIDPWVDEKKLLPGQDWRTKIEEAVETSDTVIICLSNSSVGKEGFVQKELRYAREIAFEKPDETIFLIPLRLDDCLVPRGLRFYQWGDYFGEKQEDTYVALIEALKIRYEQMLKLEEEERAHKEKERLERDSIEKAAREKVERETAERIAREKAEKEAAENKKREKAEREDAERSAREKVNREAAEKAKREKAERQVARKVAMAQAFSKSFTSLIVFLVKAKPFFRIVSAVGIVIVLFLIGSWAIPKLALLVPTATPNLMPASYPSVTYTFAVSLLPPTKTLTPQPITTKTQTPTSTATLQNEITDEKGVLMVLVPAGDFIMGSDEGGNAEKPKHTVKLDAYYIDKYEVTNSNYKECVDAGVCVLPSTKGSATRSSYYGNSIFDDYPVINVTWNKAASYCEWRGASLPTEAQWEKAARSSDERTYPWGEEIYCNISNYSSCVGDTTKVGLYTSGQSPYGVYDLAGNVWEWTADWYSENYYQDTPLSNPLGPSTGTYRVLRGGSWLNYNDLTRSYVRDRDVPTYSGSLVGFRCAFSAEQKVTMISDLPAEIIDDEGVSMMLVQAGEFTMGSNIEDAIKECEKYQSNCEQNKSFSREETSHQVYLDAYYIDKYEVTNMQYKNCVKAGVCGTPFDKKSSTHSDYYDNPQYGNYPFMGAFLSDATIYCEWREAKLPTEAQWEKAARGTDGRIYPWGNNFDSSRANSCDKNCPSELAVMELDDGYGDTAPVGSYENGVSPYGVYDLAGNVWEYVADLYSETYTATPPYLNPLGSTTGQDIIARGGSWGQDPARLRTSARFIFPSAIFMRGGVGFRCAKNTTP